MNIIRILILSALGIGALAFATPSKADERVYINGRVYYSDRYHHHRHYYRDWERDRRGRVIIRGSDSDVSVAFGGHPRYYQHRHYYRDWDR